VPLVDQINIANLYQDYSILPRAPNGNILPPLIPSLHNPSYSVHIPPENEINETFTSLTDINMFVSRVQSDAFFSHLNGMGKLFDLVIGNSPDHRYTLGVFR